MGYNKEGFSGYRDSEGTEVFRAHASYWKPGWNAGELFLMEGEGIETNGQEALFLGRVRIDPKTVNSIKKHQCKRKGEYTTETKTIV